MTASDTFWALLAFVLLSLAGYLTWGRIQDTVEKWEREQPQETALSNRRTLLALLVLGLGLLGGGLMTLLLLWGLSL
jgi:hypothetical protein